MPVEIFLSYNHRDHADVERIASRLRESGISVILDRWYLRPGDYWPHRLEQVLNSCSGVCIFQGPAGMGNWQQREYFFALDRQTKDPNFKVYPVILPGGNPALSFLSLFNWTDLREDNQPLEALIQYLKGEEGVVSDQPPEICPFQGLRAFREEDAAFFFGRTKFTDTLEEAVGKHNLVGVIGASGSGKSSVVRAGLIPRLRRQQPDTLWEIAIMVPQQYPFKSLAGILIPLLESDRDLSEVQLIEHINELADSLITGRVTLKDVVDRLLAKQPGTDRLLLVIDQWEELYTLTEPAISEGKKLNEPEVRKRFIEMLLAASQDSRLRIVFTLRGDFMGHVLAYRPLVDHLHDLKLGPMDRMELKEVIEKPAEGAGLTFADKLDRRILDDVGDEPGNLPLLEFALLELWNRREGAMLNHAVYETIGGIKGALARRADEIYKGLKKDDQVLLQRVFLRLVRPGEGAADTRRRADLSAMSEPAQRLVLDLAKERLLVTSRDDVMNKEQVEVTHEALIKEWGKLKVWVDKNRAFLLWQQRINIRLEDWEKAERDKEALLRGAPLLEALEYLDSNAEDIGLRVKQFIKHSKVAHEKAIEEESRRREAELENQRLLAEQQRKRAEDQMKATQRFRWLSIGIGFLAFISAFVGWQARQAGREARENLLTANYRLAVIYENTGRQLLQDSTMSLAWLYFSNALAQDIEPGRNLTYAKERLLNYTVTKKSKEEYWESPTLPGSVLSVAFSPTGNQIVSSGEDGRIQVWDSNNGHLITELIGNPRLVRSISFSPSGDRIVSGQEGGILRIWDIDESNSVFTRYVSGHVWSVAYNPSGDRIVSGDADGSLKIWDDASGELLLTVNGDLGPIRSVSYSPSGDRIVSGGESGVVRIWDSNRGVLLYAIKASSDVISSVSYSPSGDQIASGGFDGIVRIWDSENGELVTTLSGHTGRIRSLGYNASGSQIVTGANDRTVRVWDSESGELLKVLSGHTGSVSSIAITPLGDRIASGGEDGAVRLWDSESGAALYALSGHFGMINSAAYSPSGEHIVSGGEDGTVQIWDSESGTALNVLSSHNSPVNSVSYSPFGNLIVSGGADGMVRIWDSESASVLLVLSDSSGSVHSVAFSPSGDEVVSGGADGSVRIWSSQRGELLHVLTGHTSAVRSVAFSRTGKEIVSGGEDGMIRVWDSDNGEVLSVFGDENSSVTSVAFSFAGDHIASGGGEGSVKVWDIERAALAHELGAYEAAITSVVYSPSGKRIASGGHDGMVRIWDSESGDLLNTLGSGVGSISSVIYSPSGDRIVSASEDGSLRYWDSEEGDAMDAMKGSMDRVWSVDYSPTSDRIVSGSEDGIVRIWDGKRGELLNKLTGHDGSVWSVAYSPSGEHIVSGGTDGTLRIWNSASGNSQYIISSHEGRIWSVAYNLSGSRIVSGGADGMIRIWSNTGEFLHEINGQSGRIWAVAYNPFIDQITTGGDDGVVRIWDVESGEVIQELKGHTDRVRNVSYHPSGNQIVTGSADSTVYIWDNESGDPLQKLIGHTDWVLSVSYSPSGEHIVSGGGDGTIRIWNSKSGELLQELTGHTLPVWSASYNPLGDRIISGGADGTVRIWDLRLFQRHSNLLTELPVREKLHERAQYFFKYSFDGENYNQIPTWTYFVPVSRDVPPLEQLEFTWLDRPRPDSLDLIGWLLLDEVNPELFRKLNGLE